MFLCLFKHGPQVCSGVTGSCCNVGLTMSKRHLLLCHRDNTANFWW